MYKSWDFWDTLITRLVPTPKHLFHVLEEKLRLPGFAAARIEAELKSRAGVEETSLTRIYQHLPGSDEFRANAMLAEMELEMALASPIRRNLSRLGPDDVIVSDTYLESTTLSNIATRCGKNIDPIRILSSCEEGATKHTGRLYRVLLSRYGVPAIHSGDNIHSDIQRAQEAGLNTSHYRDSDAYHVELSAFRRGGDNEYLAGALRAARLASPVDKPDTSHTWHVYSQVVAPVLVAFADWLVADVVARGIERLAFLARDGQILKAVADELIAARGLNLRTYYVYTSRQALHLPGHISLSESASWLFDSTKALTLRTIASRIQDQQLESISILSRYTTATVDENLSESDRKKLLKVIHDPDFERLVSAKAIGARHAALSYFSSLGIFDNHETPVAIIDVGWRGRMQRSLSNILQQHYGRQPKLRGYYLALSPSAFHLENDLLHGFLYDPFSAKFKGRRCWIDGYRGIVEFLLRADHASTMGYMRTGDTAAPLLAQPLPETEYSDIRMRQEAILAFATRYCALEHNLGRSLAHTLSHSIETFKRFLQRPSLQDANSFLGCTHSEQQSGGDESPLVTRCTPVQLLASDALATSLWPEGTAAASRALWLYRLRRFFLRGIGRIRYLLKMY